MDTSSGTPAVGTALVVYGTVKIESADGVTKIVQPNEPINLFDRIDTGQDGSLTVAFNDGSDTLELGRMTHVVIDQDIVHLGDDLDLADVTTAPELLQDALQGWSEIQLAQPPESILPDIAVDHDTFDMHDSDALMSAPEKIELGDDTTDVASTEADDGDGASVDDMHDLSSLIPPPDDVS